MSKVPGQNEIDFKFSDPLGCADNLLTFKTVVKTVAARNGLFASFAPKPLPGKSGSGLHINLSISRNGLNVFKSDNNEYSSKAESFIAGVLQKTPEITAFLNPTPVSYDRFGEFEAPKYVSWSYGNRSQLVRIPAAAGEKVRMELRSPDPTINPYLAFALVISAGLYGIDNKLSLPESANVDLYTAEKNITNKLTALPGDMEQALKLAEESEFVKSILPREIYSKFLTLKKEENKSYIEAADKREHFLKNYFKYI